MNEDARADALLRRAWSALGGDPALLDLVEFEGDGAGLLPSVSASLPAMCAAVAASTLAASVLDGVRRKAEPLPVVIDRQHVAAAARSEHYARSAALPKEDRIPPLSLFWSTADGAWFRIHGEYPWHRDRALALLGCEDSHRGVKRAVATWRADELEEALADVQALGYSVRTSAQWAAHPQGEAVARLPLLQMSTGEGPTRVVGPGRVAEGIRVLDLTRVLAGPIATRTLAAWGAEVLRLDSPRLPELATHSIDMLSGKRSAELDLADRAGRARLEQLLNEADLLVQGYRPGALARFGLTPEDLAERHPHLSVVSLSAWGPNGPWSQRRGFDSLVQCVTGIALTEGSNGRPGWLPAQVLDHATGYLAAAAAFSALASAQQDGRPRSARLSLAQVARWLTDGGPEGPKGPEGADAPRPLDVEPYRVELRGPGGRVDVIGPPGRLTDRNPSWTFTTDPGVDPPAFSRVEPR